MVQDFPGVVGTDPLSRYLCRVFSPINPEEFGKCFVDWFRSAFPLGESDIVAIDGKTAGRSHDRINDKSAIHVVSAWAVRNRLILGQVKTDDKSNEITAIPELLKTLDIQGCIVTTDAMGCQKEIVRQIVGQGADYVLSLKGNQGNLHKEVELFFQDAKHNGYKDEARETHTTVDGRYTTLCPQSHQAGPDQEDRRQGQPKASRLEQ